MTHDMKHNDMKRNNVTMMTRKNRLILLLLMMTMGATGAWGDDLPGVYFIASRDYVESNTTTNFYLCPTENWFYYQSTSPYYTNTPNGMPFMTTYKCRDGVYDVLNAVWSIEKKGNTNYYYIKHLSDGKYLTYNVAMGDKSNAGRMRVHLEASPADDDAAQFQITYVDANSCYEITTKKENSRKYLNPTGPSSGNGNINSLVGTNARTDGPTGCPNVGGIIGLWTGGSGSDNNSKWYLEDASFLVCATPTITYNESNGEVSMSTTTAGADIYYTTDGTPPTSSSTKYVNPFTLSSSADIKAIAVKDGMLNSAIASKKVVDYTYHILNRSNNVAITKTVRQVVGTPLNGYADIPADIRSPYISNETIKFYDQSANFDDEYTIEETPASDTGTADIYVTYSVDKLSQKYLKLQGARAMNVTLAGEYIFATSGALSHESSDTNIDNNSHLWRFYGGDPYDVQVMNVGTDTYLHYDTPTGESEALSLNGTPSVFIIMDGAVGGVGIDAGQMELMAATGDANYFRAKLTDDNFTISKTATGDASLQVRAYPNSSSKNYLLIDKSGHLIVSVSNKSETLSLPAEWLSPLAEYQYWNQDAIDQAVFTETGIYKIREATDEVPAPQPITRFEQATGDIYVTYTSNSRIDFSGATTYLLE